MRFTDTSDGYVSAWEWTFGTNGRAAEANPFFVFTEVGQQDVVLRVVNRNSGCEDISESLEVNISESELEVPNVFSPNGDGVNDEFRVAYRSLKKFEMVVFNRWGRKVYESSDPADGWDGTIGNTLAAPGVYFYYIRGVGYNADEVYELKGPIHLIRGKN
jgi:gliding motility-associated-like protein